MEQTTLNEREIFLDIATEAVMSAGVILQDLLGQLEKIEEKGRPGDLVTEADKKAETAILEVLGRRVPHHRILAEESGKLGAIESDYLWAIDPLDGTTNYAHSYPMSAVSVGLLLGGVSLVGAVYNPFRRELFRGARGLGATLNYRPIRVSKTTELSKSLLVTGFAYDRRETKDTNYPEFCYLTHLTQGVRRSGSASLDLTDVACGRLDGYWERGLSPWDIAAGIVILEEAGGKITAYDESPLSIESGRLLATNGIIHHQVSQELNEALPWLKSFYK
ncbi:inositol monophosphatase family protein [Aphanothece sacrum]|uniref:Inositol-1-monophosphatase n=1 Tax=Aphanothece sacrum FPU1 TaxID=1920663 RepID=A0A401ILX5_APHSA|nr:inositol monophosphatase family protein [Aphanothece sacrum]GBF82238.1 inositol monophosphatase [Aphanothece sacrum FPU1]GBF87224.1 inositol monophosphatase [Aphanothece sacrum FPU3]